MNISAFSLSRFGRLILSGNNISIRILSARSLYTPEALGVDGYLQGRERIKMQFSEMGERFRTKMHDFVAPKSPNMVFTEDLKHMAHLAEGTEEDLQLIEDMVLKFNRQNRELRFGSFIFGPVLMRMYYYLNKPKEALKIFKHPELDSFFNQIISYQLLMDLLFKNDMYDEVMEVADIVKDKQFSGSRFPRNIVVLALAAAYKKNSPESLEYMKKLWSELQEAGHEPARRALAFGAALAINQGSPHIALELLSQLPRQHYVTVRNLKVSALADVNRLDDALPILRSVLETEGPKETKHTFCSDVLDKVKTAVEKSDSKEVQQEFQRISSQLTQLGHISNKPLDEVLCSEIEKIILNPQNDRRILAAKFDSSQQRRRNRDMFQAPQRVGLRDME